MRTFWWKRCTSVLVIAAAATACGDRSDVLLGDPFFEDAGTADSAADAAPARDANAADRDAFEDAPVDAGEDAMLDAGEDAMLDAGEDAMLDAGEDAMLDATIDAGADAGEDSGVDAGIDATTDANVPNDATVLDAAPDASVDAPNDAPEEADAPFAPTLVGPYGVLNSLGSGGVEGRAAQVEVGSNGAMIEWTGSDDTGQLLTASTQNVLVDAFGAIGTWSAGTYATTPGATTTLGTNEALHYALAFDPTTLPTTGTATYSLLAATAPTISDGSQMAGVVTSATATQNFATSAYTLSVTITMPDGTYTIQDSGRFLSSFIDGAGGTVNFLSNVFTDAPTGMCAGVACTTVDVFLFCSTDARIFGLVSLRPAASAPTRQAAIALQKM